MDNMYVKISIKQVYIILEERGKIVNDSSNIEMCEVLEGHETHIVVDGFR